MKDLNFIQMCGKKYFAVKRNHNNFNSQTMDTIKRGENELCVKESKY